MIIKKDKAILIRLETDLKYRAAKKASDEGITLSRYIRKLIKKDLNE